MKNIIEEIIGKYGFGITVENLAELVYRELALKGFCPSIMNDRYISVDGANYQLIKSRSKGQWTVKKF